MRASFLLPTVLALSLLAPTPAWAARPTKVRAKAESMPSQFTPKERAQALLAEGNRLLDQAQYLDALARFREAYAAYPSPKLHFNIAQTCNELGRLLDALHHYELFVRDVKKEESPEQWRLAHERIFKLQGSIATVTLQTNVIDVQVAVDGSVLGRTPLDDSIRFMPGPHAIVLSKPGYDKQVIELHLKAGDSLQQRVKMLTEEEAASTRRAVLQAEAERQAAQERLLRVQEAEEKKRTKTRLALRATGWTLLATGAALALATGVLGILSIDEASQVEDAPAGTSWKESGRIHNDRAVLYSEAFYYGIAIGGAQMIAAAGLLAYAYRGKIAEKPAPTTPARAQVVVIPGSAGAEAGLSLLGRF